MRTDCLHICLLGDFQLVYGDQMSAPDTTSINTPRLQALIGYLLLHRAAPQAREHLAFRFWPDTNEAQALTNLRNLLHKLRQVLPTPEQFLQINTHTIQWRPTAPYTLDVADFEQNRLRSRVRSTQLLLFGLATSIKLAANSQKSANF